MRRHSPSQSTNSLGATDLTPHLRGRPSVGMDWDVSTPTLHRTVAQPRGHATSSWVKSPQNKAPVDRGKVAARPGAPVRCDCWLCVLDLPTNDDVPADVFRNVDGDGEGDGVEVRLAGSEGSSCGGLLTERIWPWLWLWRLNDSSASCVEAERSTVSCNAAATTRLSSRGSSQAPSYGPLCLPALCRRHRARPLAVQCQASRSAHAARCTYGRRSSQRRKQEWSGSSPVRAAA